MGCLIDVPDTTEGYSRYAIELDDEFSGRGYDWRCSSRAVIEAGVESVARAI